MKDPKDMSREELVTTLGIVAAGLAIYGMTSWADKLHEAATRLRNSIDRPTVEVENECDCAVLMVNGRVVVYDHTEVLARDYQLRFLDALGMEGGEG